MQSGSYLIHIAFGLLCAAVACNIILKLYADHGIWLNSKCYISLAHEMKKVTFSCFFFTAWTMKNAPTS